ncbi:hypothetical protein LUZ60_009266 [Juncus effusus]|nr:hypothetical protein LUZ60_009266 [Juncus effusus]
MDIEKGETEIVRVGERETSIPIFINKGVTNSPSKWGIVRKSVGSLSLESKLIRKMDVEIRQSLLSVKTPRLIETDTDGPRASIFDVPDRVELVVPIGPYHSTDDRNKALISVRRKWICVKYLIEYFSLNFSNCLTQIELEKERISKYYAENMLTVYNSNDTFKELFFLDSCFIWFFIYIVGYKYLYPTKNEGTNSTKLISLQNIVDQHLLSYITCKENQIKMELLMLGNQIPWFLIEVINNNVVNIDILHSTPICFESIYPGIGTMSMDAYPFRNESFQHLLHVFHCSLVSKRKYSKHWAYQIFRVFGLPGLLKAAIMKLKSAITMLISASFISSKENLISPPTNSDDKKDESIDLLKFETSLCVPNAVELHESSTSFKRLRGSFDIIFHRKSTWPSATMQISPLHIFDYSSTIFKHLIKFEQKYQRCGFHVTGYMTRIARLLQTKEDVNLLRKNNILPNTMTNDEQILEFVQEMRVETRGARVPHDLKEFYRKVTKHHGGKLNRAYGGFKNHFCPSPWITFSFLGGFIIFIITIVKTIYDIPHNKF